MDEAFPGPGIVKDFAYPLLVHNYDRCLLNPTQALGIECKLLFNRIFLIEVWGTLHFAGSGDNGQGRLP